MPPKRRPTAFEVSFGEVLEPTPSAGPSSIPQKRGNDGYGLMPPPKRPKPPEVVCYKPKADELVEPAKYQLPGEEEEEDHDSLPIRVLSDFSIFDSKHANEMISLDAMDTDEGRDRVFAAAGYVTVHREDEDVEDQAADDDEQPLRYVRLRAIVTWTMSLVKPSDPVYIQTHHAIYILDGPSKEYTETFKYFITPRSLAQALFSQLLKKPQLPYPSFIQYLTNQVDTLGRTWLERDFALWVADLDTFLDNLEADIPEPDRVVLRNSPLVKRFIIGRAPKGRVSKVHKQQRVKTWTRQLPTDRYAGNPDLAVALPERLNSTHVTPRIANLAYGLVHEELRVVGARLPSTWKESWEKASVERGRRVKDLILQARIHRPRVRWDTQDKVRLGSKYLKKVTVEKKEYSPGDVIIAQSPGHPIWRGQCENAKFDIGDIFWLGLIVWLDRSDTGKGVHVQWLEVASSTLLQELAHPQEVFLTNSHDDRSWSQLIGKVTVHWNPPPDEIIPPGDFFCRQMYHCQTSAWSSIPEERLTVMRDKQPGYNCPSCIEEAEQIQQQSCVPIKDDGGFTIGYEYMCQTYHLHDFILYYGNKDAAEVGYITGIQTTPPPGEAFGFVTILKVGRMVDLSHLMPKRSLSDERELYMTKEKDQVWMDGVLGTVGVQWTAALAGEQAREKWLTHSPRHFYITYEFPTLKPARWSDRTSIKLENYEVCALCWADKFADMKHMQRFLQRLKDKGELIPTLDLFAGSGAFSRGIAEGSGCLKVTHAIEISPSAALTLERNNPGLIVYNQCANTMLRQMIKTWEGHSIDEVKQLHSGKPIPAVPTKGYIKAIVAGFPCQAHSKLNMFQNANDVRNNLMLTTLSYVDALRPDYVFFENVPHFLDHRLNAKQAGAHRVEGGIDHGGIKIVVRGLLDLGYQVHFAKLQAAHYGTPQDRLRLIIIAAKQGKTLPKFPQPTHGFTSSSFTKLLKMTLPYGRLGQSEEINPDVRTKRGTAPHPPVTIEDAISDLAPFNWRTSKAPSNARQRGPLLPEVYCDPEKKFWGYQNRAYDVAPQTRFQLDSRGSNVQSIQHYTTRMDPGQTKRIIEVPLTKNANYLELTPQSGQWVLNNPLASGAKDNHRTAKYGRLDRKELFPTTVGQIGPTNKQSKVLHPWCKRMLSVRELARSQGFPDDFFFVALQDRVKTIHTQIGNAVPLPLGRAIGRELRAAVILDRGVGKERALIIQPIANLAPPLVPRSVVEDDDDDMYV